MSRGSAAARVLLCALLTTFAASSFAAGKTIAVERGKEFRLLKGETARFDSGRALLRITKFINSPCPKGAYCVWSGQAVMFELTVDGKVVPGHAKNVPYEVAVKDSDYTTYALFLVDEPVQACFRIAEERTRGLCLEDRAEELHRDELCAGVASPTQHCLYLKAKKSGDLGACDLIVTRRARRRCFKALSTEGGGGPRSCADLPAEAAARCREFALGPND